MDSLIVIFGAMFLLVFLGLGIGAKAWILTLVSGFVGLALVAGLAHDSYSIQDGTRTIYLGEWGVAIFLISVIAIFFIGIMQSRGGDSI